MEVPESELVKLVDEAEFEQIYNDFFQVSTLKINYATCGAETVDHIKKSSFESDYGFSAFSFTTASKEQQRLESIGELFETKFLDENCEEFTIADNLVGTKVTSEYRKDWNLYMHPETIYEFTNSMQNQVQTNEAKLGEKRVFSMPSSHEGSGKLTRFNLAYRKVLEDFDKQYDLKLNEKMPSIDYLKTMNYIELYLDKQRLFYQSEGNITRFHTFSFYKNWLGHLLRTPELDCNQMVKQIVFGFINVTLVHMFEIRLVLCKDIKPG